MEFGYVLRVVVACAKKDIKTALSERLFTILGVFIPVNFLILMSLFALAGGYAPTAVVMNDTGPYAQQFYSVMDHAHSFHLLKASAQEADKMLQAGNIVAVVTIPTQFDQRMQSQSPVTVDVKVNNLNTDFTNDVRRAMPLSITSFYAKAFPHVVPITTQEHDWYQQDTDYIPYLAVSILVLSLAVGGLLQSGTSAAREWEKETMKELLLSPANRGAIVVGKMLGALIMSLASIVVVIAVLVLVIHIYPVHWGEVLGFTLLSLVLFNAVGSILGTLLKDRLRVMALSLGVSIPLFFASSAFGPLSLTTPAVSVIAQIFPLYYAIVLQQHAFHGFVLDARGPNVIALILAGYTLLLIVLAALVLRRSNVAH